MDSIFVNSLYPFEANFSYNILPNGVINFDYPKQDNSHTLKFIAYGPTFELVSKGLEEATYINHITGNPFIRTSILYAEIFQKAIVQVEFPDVEELKTIVVKKTDLNSLHYNLIKIVCKQWLKDVL